MNRNSQNHFANIPSIDIQRSKFRRPFTHKTTFNSGDLIPFFVDEILPGDTVQLPMAGAIRMATPIFPVMDNAFIDTYFFYVPFRLVWEHYQEFMGENKLTAWEQPVEYEIPQIKAPDGGWQAGTIADYMGIPTKVDNFSISSLYFRAYCLIWNEWFRDQNLKDAAMVNLDDTTVTGANDGDYVINTQLGAKPLKAARYHSYFTSALPEPQKGPDVAIPFAGSAGMLPVVTKSREFTNDTGYASLRWKFADSAGTQYNLPYGKAYELRVTNGLENGQDVTTKLGPEETDPSQQYFGRPVNLWADASTGSLEFTSTINALRQAFAVQRLYERDARGGKKLCLLYKKPFLIDLEDLKRGRQGASVMVA